jgi:phage minor structural protein
MGPGGPEISIGDWLQSEDGPAQGTVWIVKKIEQQVESRTWTIQAEHAINLLRRRILPGEVKPEDMGGSTTGCTARQAAAYILSRQSDWVLGDCAFSDSHPYSFNGDDLFSALETVSNSLDGCVWEYDFSVYPFRLHLRQETNGVESEIRLSRNARTIRRTIDTQDTCTRFYPVGKENLKLPGVGYVSRNEGLYGVFEQTDTDESLDSVAKLTDWADSYLRRHAHPLVTLVVDGMELAQDTGESLDRFRIGRLCRVPLVEYGEAAVTERISKIDYPDAEGDPEKCTITIGGEIDDIAKIVSRMQKKSGGGGRASAKNAEEDHAWIEDTTEHVYLVAEALVGKDPSGAPVDWTRVSVLGVDGTGIHGRVTVAEDELVQQESRIDATETAITTEVTDRTNADSELSGRVTVEAGKISQIVSAVGADGEVTAASIVLAINQSTGESEAKIDAQHVYIGNDKSTTVINGKLNASDVTANYIKGKIGDIAQVVMNGASVVGDLYIRNGSGQQQNASAAIWDIQLTQNGNTYTLKRKRIQDADYVEIGTFSRATSLSGAWSGGVLTVSASPQGNTFKADLFTAGHWGYASSESKTTYYGSISAKHNGGSTSYSTGESFEVDASQIYTNGYNSGYSKGSPSSGTAGGRTSGVSALVHDFTIKRADGTTKTLQIDVSNIYTTARSGYYTQSQYDAHYRDGYSAGWAGYYNDSANWYSDWDVGGGNHEVWVPGKTKTWNGSGWNDAGSEKWFTYSSSGTNPYPTTRTFRCTGKTFSQSNWVYTFQYTISNSDLWTVGNSYKFHHNSNYS